MTEAQDKAPNEAPDEAPNEAQNEALNEVQDEAQDEVQDFAQDAQARRHMMNQWTRPKMRLRARSRRGPRCNPEGP